MCSEELLLGRVYVFVDLAYFPKVGFSGYSCIVSQEDSLFL